MNPKHIEPKMVKLWAFLDCVLGCLVLVPTKMVTGKFLNSCSTGRGCLVYALVTKDVGAVAGFRYIFMLHIVV